MEIDVNVWGNPNTVNNKIIFKEDTKEKTARFQMGSCIKIVFMSKQALNNEAALIQIRKTCY
jgi:hypothetical protein